MSEFVISTRYANALMAFAEEKNIFDSTIKDVSFIFNTFKDSKELRNFVSSPIVNSEKKASLLLELFNNNISNYVSSYLVFLVKKGRENLIFDICKRFIELSNEKLNRVEVEVTSAIELNEVQKNDLKQKLEKMIDKIVIPTFNVSNDLIGGFKAKFNDTVIDATIKHQLELLKKKLFEENYLRN